MRLRRDFAYKLDMPGGMFHNGKGTVREFLSFGAENHSKLFYRKAYRLVTWKKVHGGGPESGTMNWSSWRVWCKGEWLEPCPDQLPVPEVTDADRAFPTGQQTPPWRWVPAEFKSAEGGSWNRDNPWVKLAADVFVGARLWSNWSAIPKPGINPQKAFDAVDVTMRNWGMKHENKIATCGWMLSEWFSDFWFEGDTHTTIGNLELPKKEA